jgi:hypothetical protein
VRTLRGLLNIAYTLLAREYEGGAEKLDRDLGVPADDDGQQPGRRPQSDPRAMALLAAAMMPQQGYEGAGD